MPDNSDTIDSCHAHLVSVLERNVPLDSQLVNRMADRLKMDQSLFLDESNNPSNSVIIRLLPPSISILKVSTLDAAELESAVELIEALLAPKSFDEVLGFISIDDMVAGLESGILPLQTVCIKQIMKAQPPDLVANTPLVDKLLVIFADPNSRCTQAVQDALIKLGSRGELVMKRLFSETSSNLLHQMHDSNDALQQARLMSLLEGFLSYKLQVPSNFIQFPVSLFDVDAPSWDLFQNLTAIQFYRTILENSALKSLIKDITDQIHAIAKLFSKRDENSEIRDFLNTEIFLLFREISYKDIDLFGELDNQYGIVSSVRASSSRSDRESLLTFVNPKCLIRYPSIIDSVKFISSDITILRNLCSYEPTFNRIDPDQKRLMSLNYQDLLLLLIIIAQTHFGLTKLLQDWPQVMNSVISKKDIRVPETFNLRRELLTILIQKPESTLGVWHDGVKHAYSEIIFGPGYGQEVQVAVSDKTY